MGGWALRPLYALPSSYHSSEVNFKHINFVEVGLGFLILFPGHFVSNLTECSEVFSGLRGQRTSGSHLAMK